MFKFTNNLIKTDVTALKLLDNHILAGIGGRLLVFQQTKQTELIKECDVFTNGDSIHGIEVDSTFENIIINGGTHIKIISTNSFKETHSQNAKDWILTSKCLKNSNNIAIIVMNNKLIVYSSSLEKITEFQCKEKCILYSAFICDSFNELILLSGTVFSEILVWKPEKNQNSPVLAKLTGHKGVIFAISYNPASGLIASCSDDRSTIIWQTENANLAEELLKEKPNITSKLKLFGHSSRIFRCKVLQNAVITAGEDSVVNIWNFRGELLRKIETHQGGCIWAIDSNSQSVISGSENSAISVFPLTITKTEKTLKIDGEILRKAVILKSGNIAAVCESGKLFYFNAETSENIEIAHFDFLKSYSLVEVSKCREMVAVAGYNGEILVYKEEKFNLKNLIRFQTDTKKRILALHWLTCTTFLTCENNGTLCLFLRRNSTLFMVKTFNLPKMHKEMCSTTACSLTNGSFLVGDRKGNIFVFDLHNSRPVQTLKKVHNFQGVTHIAQTSNKIISLGRNGLVKTFRVRNNKLEVISSDKLPFSWLAKLENHLISCFSGSSFVLFDYASRRVVFEEDCGGGHRSWDFYESRKEFLFSYIKENSIRLSQIEKASVFPREIVAGFHSREINALKAIQLDEENAFLIVSGGEDTNLRLSLISETDKFTELITLKAHLSNIRCISLKTLKRNEFLVFSGGGRREIIMWHLEITETEPICRQLSVFQEKSNENDAETRIMDLKNVENFLFAACSDGKILIFLILDENQLQLVSELTYKRKCITKISILKVANEIIPISFTTDGKVSFWNWKQSKISACFKLHQSGINTCSFFQVTNEVFACLTGGDDNKIALNIFKIEKECNIIKLDEFSDVGTHCAQITGSFIARNHFLTCSIDQKLVIFTWSYKNKLVVEKNGKFCTAVPDIQGFECFNLKNKEFDVFIFGKGLNYVRLKDQAGFD